MSEVHPNPSVRWSNRRRMAYISITCLVCILLWVVGLGTYSVITGKTLAEVAHITTILSTLAVGFVSIIGAYVGFATWGDKYSSAQSPYGGSYASNQYGPPPPYGRESYPGNNLYTTPYPGDPYASTEKPDLGEKYS